MIESLIVAVVYIIIVAVIAWVLVAVLGMAPLPPPDRRPVADADLGHRGDHLPAHPAARPHRRAAVIAVGVRA
jgi:hypothetical protein